MTVHAQFGSLLAGIVAMSLLQAIAQAREQSGPPRKLTVLDAASLVRLAIKPQIRDVKPVGAVTLDKYGLEPDIRFFSFTALSTWSTTEVGSSIFGDYSVNRRNGEVWYDTACQEIMFPALVARQREIRSSLGISEQQYQMTKHQIKPALC
jgi:hypothetical protein